MKHKKSILTIVSITVISLMVGGFVYWRQLGFAASVGIIGGADGPTVVYSTGNVPISKLLTISGPINIYTIITFIALSLGVIIIKLIKKGKNLS